MPWLLLHVYQTSSHPLKHLLFEVSLQVAYPSPFGRNVPEFTLFFILKQLRCNFRALHAFRPLLPRLSTFSTQCRNLHFPVLEQVSSLNNYLHLIRTSNEANMQSIFVILHNWLPSSPSNPDHNSQVLVLNQFYSLKPCIPASISAI